MTRDDIARLRHEIAQHRQAARLLLERARAAHDRGALLDELNYKSLASARRQYARQAEAEIRDWRLAERVYRAERRRMGLSA